MAGTRMMLGVWIWSVWVMAVGVVAGEELGTVAYVVDRAGFDGLGREWFLQDEASGREVDPFAEDAEVAFVEPTRLEKKPNGTRFFRDGDRMWLLTGTLRQLKILEDDRSWAVWNKDTSRLVVHGSAREHGYMAVLWEDLNHVTLVETSVELVRVRCRELGRVHWTEQEVRKRGGQLVHAISATARPGQKASAVLGTEAGEVRLEIEPNTNDTLDIVDLRLSYSGAVRHPDGVRMLVASTGMSVLAGHVLYVEVGGADGGGETYLLAIRAFAKSMDGTPWWRWREFENDALQERPPGTIRGRSSQTVLDDGMILSRVMVGRTFLSDMAGVQDPEDDPFAPDPPRGDNVSSLRKQAEVLGFRVVDAFVDQPGCLKTDLVFDAGELMKNHGISIPKGGWVYFNMTRGVLIAKLDERGTDLLDVLTEVIDDGLPRMIAGTLTLIEWEGEREPGAIPAGARRLARVGMLGRPGQKATVRHGWPVEELKRGVSLEMEPNIGAGDWMLDAWVNLEVAGERSARLATGLTMVKGEPVVVPLGEVDGKKLGVVMECRMIDGTGAELR